AIGLGGAVAVGSRQERGHLTSRDGAVWAEPVVVGRVTAAGDPGGSQGIDVGLEDRVLVVGEAVWAVRELEGAADECRDLAACDGLVGTESVVAGRVAAPGYVGSPDRLDVLLVDRAVVVYERSPRWKLACGWKCSPDDERSDE